MYFVAMPLTVKSIKMVCVSFVGLVRGHCHPAKCTCLAKCLEREQDEFVSCLVFQGAQSELMCMWRVHRQSFSTFCLCLNICFIFGATRGAFKWWNFGGPG